MLFNIIIYSFNIQPDCLLLPNAEIGDGLAAIVVNVLPC